MGVAHMCLAPLSMTENFLWEHYNDMAAEMDAKQCKDIANSVLIFVRPPSPRFILSL